MSSSLFPTRTAWTLGWFVALALSTHFGARWLGWVEDETNEEGGVSSLGLSVLPIASGEDVPLPAALTPGAGPAPPPPSEKRRSLNPSPLSEHPIEDFGGPAMDAFYKALNHTASGEVGALTRVVHYGDSMLTGDSISDAVRRRLQARFGDGGHGFVLAGRPWPWYRHMGIGHWNSAGFRVNRITKNSLEDGLMGLGCVSFRSYRPGARFFVEPEEPARVSLFDVFYLEQPNGGSLRLTVDGHTDEIVSTRADSVGSGFRAIEVPDGAHRLTVTNAGGGEVRIYGVAIERAGPGVVYDSLGVNGLHASNFTRFDRSHLDDQIRHRSPNLIVVMLGTNESQNSRLDLAGHASDFTTMLELLRGGAPQASCLVVSPPDRAMRAGRGRLVSRPIISRIVARQREVARDAGCGFWNTYEAMGGEDSAADWRRRHPALMGGDLTHPTPEGADILGGLLAAALISGYERFISSE